MLTPNGQSANKIEKVMLLSLWANALNNGEVPLEDFSKFEKLIFAGIGKPTYPINEHTISSYLTYWKNLDNLSQAWHLDAEQMDEGGGAIDYGDPRGDIGPREMMAQSMSRWYESDIKPENVLFTVGGIGALRVIFETFNSHYEDIPGYRIITPFPHYSAYSNNPLHRLHPIDVMSEPGYKLTASALDASIKDAYELAQNDHGWPKAILICNPSNPLGTVIDKMELNKIAEILRQHPELYIIFDEAYTEMNFVEMPSLLKIAPDLKDRIIIMRSATKALSAAGERMAVLLVFDRVLMSELLNKNISYFIHAPRSAQIAYAQTMAKFDEFEQNKLIAFYKKKVAYVMERLHMMGAEMPDLQYQVEATFYALGDFSDLFDLDLPNDVYQALQKSGKVSTGEDLAYYLLFKERLMIAPLSYFGLSKDCGFMRITCSGSEPELQELMDRLERCLFEARYKKKVEFLEWIGQKLPDIERADLILYNSLSKKVALIAQGEDNCLNLKVANQALCKIQSLISSFLAIGT